MKLPIKPRPLEADEKNHIELVYSSQLNQWAVSLHDVLVHLQFKVSCYQYPHAANQTRFQPTDTLKKSKAKKILVWPKEVDRTLQADLVANSIDCVVVVTERDWTNLAHRLNWQRNIGLLVVRDKPNEPKWRTIAAVVDGLGLGTILDEAEIGWIDKDIRAAIRETKQQHEVIHIYELAHSETPAWITTPYVGLAAARRLINMDEYGSAQSLLNMLQGRFPQSVRVRQLMALNYRRSGAYAEGSQQLESLIDKGWLDPETLGIRGACLFGRYEVTGERRYLEDSRDSYAAAFERAPANTYVGINAATKSLYLDDRQLATNLAGEIQKCIDAAAQQETRYYELATLAEAHLLKQEYDEAKTAYLRAVDSAKDDVGEHGTTLKQANQILELLQAPQDVREKIASAFPKLGPGFETVEEIRLAVVMYGGVSLAIYMNGVAQELLNLVRATAPLKATELSALPKSELKSTEVIYRELAQHYESSSLTEPGDTSPLRVRFVIDVLSGTSAGGINSVFLAKALATDNRIDDIAELWISKADMSILINDHGWSGKPKSLLDGGYMYRELLNAFNSMDKRKANSNTEHLSCTSRLDLFVTATDLNGLRVDLQLEDVTVPEKRHRQAFHFQADDFGRQNNPFLAFASRCTSAFPLAFEPMSLAQLDTLIRRGMRSWKSTTEGWQKFYAEYLDQEDDDSVSEFGKRQFGDGGYLDNKPFTHAIRVLDQRAVDSPAKRKLFYIEPAPRDKENADAVLKQFNVVGNITSALVSLPRYETIRQDLHEVERRNERVSHVRQTLDSLEADVQAAGPRYRPSHLQSTDGEDWAKKSLRDMIAAKGVSYGGYHRLKVSLLTQEVAEILTAAAGRRPDSPFAAAFHAIVNKWTKESYSETHGNGKDTQNQLLVDFDLNYRIRRLRFVIGKVDDSIRNPRGIVNLAQNRELRDRLDNANDKQLTASLVHMRRRLNRVLQELERSWEDLRKPAESGQETNALVAECQAIQFEEAVLETLCQENDSSGKVAERFVKNVADATDKLEIQLRVVFDSASDECKNILDPNLSVGLDSDLRMVFQHLYKNYEDYDQVILPASRQTGLGEIAEVDVVRFSPADVKGGTGIEDVAGTTFGAFGGFLKEDWRRNDIYWGRRHAVERILSLFLNLEKPGEKRLFDRLREEAEQIVKREESERAIRSNSSYEAGTPVEKIESKSAVRLMGRTTHVFGKVLQNLADEYKEARGVANGAFVKLSLWVTRIGRWFLGLVEVSIPGSLGRSFFNHWVNLAYLSFLVLLIGGVLTGHKPAKSLGWYLLAITLGLHVAVVLLGDIVDGWKFKAFKNPIRVAGKSLVTVAVIWCAALGALTVWTYWVGGFLVSADSETWKSRATTFSLLTVVLIAPGVLTWRLSSHNETTDRWNWFKRLVSSVVTGIIVSGVLGGLFVWWYSDSSTANLGLIEMLQHWWQHPPL